ncbi:hypothetical protein [Paraburkholderia aromaticivorans]|uniref:hypothetical protein n=1 Tax=Paraburkholderia aromaticivorans TaxID=2026199 RepID=UPI0038B92045
MTQKKQARKKETRSTDKLTYLDEYHADLLNALQRSLHASHSRVAQFCLEYAFSIQSNVKPYRQCPDRQRVLNIFIPFSTHKEKKQAEQEAKFNFQNFTGLCKTAIRKTMEDFRDSKLDLDHHLVIKYFHNDKSRRKNKPHIPKNISGLLADKHKLERSEIFHDVLTSAENTL